MSSQSMPAPVALPGPLRRPFGLLAIPAAILLVTLGVNYASGSGPGALDHWVYPRAADLPSTLREFALVINFCGEPGGAVLVVAALLAAGLLSGRPGIAVLAVAAPGLTVATTTLLKPVVGRTIHGDNLSFPSGHTGFATAVTFVAVLLVVEVCRLPAAASVLLMVVATTAAGAVMGWTEVVLGAHYPTDTLGGFCTGLVMAPSAARLIDWLVPRLRR